MQLRDFQAEMRLLRQRESKARRILGVCDSDGAEKIKHAYRKLSLKHHPDCNGGSLASHRRFALINRAYRCLTEGRDRDCEQLDAAPPATEQFTDGKYRLDNPWGYFAWWREKYFS